MIFCSSSSGNEVNKQGAGVSVTKTAPEGFFETRRIVTWLSRDAILQILAQEIAALCMRSIQLKDLDIM